MLIASGYKLGVMQIMYSTHNFSVWFTLFAANRNYLKDTRQEDENDYVPDEKLF